ncbi:MAG TPA: TSUP family transporter [Acidimicrobiia bacterium]
MWSQGRALGIGLTAGFIGGLFGVGGGIIVVPGLVLLLGFSQHQASGTSTATIVATSGAAVVGFAAGGEVDLPAAAALLAGAGLGAWLGAHYLDRVPELWLLRGFILLLLFTVARLAIT